MDFGGGGAFFFASFDFLAGSVEDFEVSCVEAARVGRGGAAAEGGGAVVGGGGAEVGGGGRVPPPPPGRY